MKKSDQTCFDDSLQSSEHLFGTVPNVNFWILIEYKDSWEKKAFNNCNIDADVKSVIRKLAGRYTKSRIQLIKNGYSNKDHIKLYIAITTETQKELFEFKIASYRDILEIDFNNELSDSTLKTDPVLLICTHGSYDNCCGEKGLELFNHITKDEKDFEVWKTTHLGGHRFAANLLILPDGIYYGRINKQNYDKIRKSHRSNHLEINMLRGRCFYTAGVQAAEYYLRSKLDYTDHDNIILISQTIIKNRTLKVIFKNKSNNISYQVLLEKNEKALQLLSSCGDKHKKFIAQHKLISISKI